jgi:hypothetical protein
MRQNNYLCNLTSHVLNSLVPEDLQAPEEPTRIRHHPLPRRDPGKASKAAMGITGVGDGKLANPRPSLNHQAEEFFRGHGHRLLSAAGVS